MQLYPLRTFKLLLLTVILSACNGDDASNTIAADTVPPEVILTSPLDGASNVAINSNIRVVFSEAVDQDSLNGSSFSLTDTDGNLVSGRISYSETSATFIPTIGLSHTHVYIVRLNTDVRDLAGNSLGSDVVWYFSTPDETAPTVTSTSPHDGGTNVDINSIISANFSEDMDLATLSSTSFTLKDAANNTINGSVSYSNRSASFIPASALSHTTMYTASLTVAATDLAGNHLVNDVVWVFSTPDKTAPSVISTSPGNGASNVALDSRISVSFSEVMDSTTLNSSSFSLKDAQSNALNGAISYSGTSAIFTPATNLAHTTVYTVTLTTAAADLAGNNLDSGQVWSFTTPDQTPPVVLSTSPGDGASNVPLNSSISVIFSEEMASATLTSSSFKLEDSDNNTVSGNISYSGTTATFTPASALAHTRMYTVSLSTAVRDLAGNPLLSDVTWRFTTPDQTPPQVVSVSPVNGASNVSLNSSISVDFSEAMAPATLNSSSFKLEDSDNNTVSGTISYSDNTATFTPASTLTHTREYTVTLTTAASDLAGNNLDSGRVWRFTTPDQTPPLVISTNPGDGASNVIIGSTVSLGFSEAMDSATLGSSFSLKGEDGNTVSGTLAYSGSAATFIPGSVLAYATVYTATLSTAATDQAGNHLEAAKVWSFTTTAEPVLNLSNALRYILEGDSDTTDLIFTVRLSEVANGIVTADYATRDVTATAGTDYIASSGTLIFNASETSKTITLQVKGDSVVETDEKFSLNLSNVSANAVLGTATSSVIILDDDASGRLNDTGIINCSNADANDLICNDVSAGTDLYPGQDAETGRDALAVAGQLTKVGGGRAGFDYTKFDVNGIPLVNQTDNYSTMPWGCVKDNNTGLVWEVKTPGGAGGLRDSNYTYSWYNSDPATNGGSVGTADGGVCAGGSGCDTEKYITDVNATNLCGYNDWRLPDLKELRSIVDYSATVPGPAIDTNYFPNTGEIPYRVPAAYWSSSPDANCSDCAWDLNFDKGDDGDSGDALKSGIDPHVPSNTPPYVRLVRGGQ